MPPLSALPAATDGRDALAVAVAIAKEAGALVREASRGSRALVGQKGRINFVTETDRASETLILRRIAEAFPQHAVLAEESQPDTEWREGYVWIVDPLDGTRNFAAGIPLYCVNIALARDGAVLLGATYDPSRDVCIAGGPGLGLTMNDARAHASTAPDLASAIVTADLGYDDDRAELQLEMLRALWREIQGARIVASAALGLAWSAAGLTDVMVHSALYPWDVAAALALLPAGEGIILDRDGGPARLDSIAVVAGGTTVVEAFMERTAGLRWR